MNPAWLRLAYAFEFLVALIAVFTGWSEIGGQGHLDAMPWHWKCILGVGMSWTIVRATAAALAHEKAWNAKCVAWLLATVLLATGMAISTYYVHVHEDDDQDNSSDSIVTSLCLRCGAAQNDAAVW
ncbi:MAG: hypothetical protein ABI165_01475 [Bryobacteraceae bacterium]